MRSRLRTLWTGGRQYAWKAEIRCLPGGGDSGALGVHLASGTGDCHRGIQVRVWGAGKNSRALQVDLLSTAWPAPYGACATDGAYPTPADVRAIIEVALAHGWEPDSAGPVFTLSETIGWELPNFLLTDRLRDPTAADPTLRVSRRR